MTIPSPIPVTLIKGDGIGPEIAQALIEVFTAAEVPVRWEEAEAGLACIEKHGTGLPAETIASIKRNRVAIKGPTTTPIGTGHKSVNVTIRKSLDLFANVRPCRSLPGVVTRFENVDLIIVRENIEDTYAGIEHMQTPDVAQCLKLITRPGCLAVARYTFEMARREKRRRITCVQKANIHKLTDGVFLEAFREVAAAYPDIESDEMLVDNCCMQLATNPQKFDVILTLNLYGDILSDLCAGLVGGLGVAPGGNIGSGRAVFEAVHGSAPDIAGKGLANPTALIMSGVQMLRYLGLLAYAARIENALRMALVNHYRTRDLGGNTTTHEFAQAVVSYLEPLDQQTLDRTTLAPIEVGHTGPVTLSNEEMTLHGLDFFVRNHGLPDLPKQVGPLSLRIISNRGTKVYPGETPDIMLVDHHRCRYLSDTPISEDDVLVFLREMNAKGVKWMHLEKLHHSGATPRYTKAQGE